MQPSPLQPPTSRDDLRPSRDLSIAARNAVTIDRAPVGIAHFDHQGRFLFVNPQLCALLGFSCEELLAMTFRDISFAEDLPQCFVLLEQLTAGAIPQFTHEKRFERSDGTFIYTRAIVSAVRDDAGKVAFFLAIVEDLSHQWAIDEARKAAEARLSLALAASATAIYSYDLRKQTLDWAHNLASLFGFPPGEELPSLQRLIGAIHPDDLPLVLELYERCRTEGADFDHEFRIVRADATVRWICDRARVSRDEDGTPRSLTGACIDVTATREALSGEQLARIDAVRAIRSRNEVLAVVAHDLRNPVHTILTSIAVAELPAIPAAERDRRLAVIRRAAHSVDHLISSLLDVAQIETRQLALDREPLPLGALLAEIVATFAPRAAAAGVRLVADAPADLPDVSADRERISQVLDKLINNALKFTPEGGEIAVTAQPRDGGVEIAIADTGCGIPADQLPDVFRRYWQSDRRTYRGAGLGLAIVKGIIDAHRGTITATSAIGEGTAFRITLPA